MDANFDLATYDFRRAKAMVSGLRQQGHKFGFTNGCFELFHYGHSEFLKNCRRKLPFGACLIVAVNDDQSFQQLKHRRPLVHEEFRRSIVASHQSVSMAFTWEGIRVAEAIRVLQPDWWFKGADYTMDTLDKSEVDAANEVDAAITLIEHVKDQSTTKLIDMIKRM